MHSTVVGMNSVQPFEKREGILIATVTCEEWVHNFLLLSSSVADGMRDGSTTVLGGL